MLVATSNLQKPAIAHDAVLRLDLSHNRQILRYAWKHGTLPRDILAYSSAQVLIAPGMGLIYLEQWITQLTELREIYLQENEITTWPHFLSQLPNLRVLVMDGNPCLELQLLKSCSFRNAFFSLNGTASLASTKAKVNKGPSELVRGPVWKPALVKKTLTNKVYGKYCGGIFTLSTPPAAQDDFLTAMGPSRLEEREGRLPPVMLNPDMGYSAECSPQTDQSALLIQLLGGLSSLNHDQGSVHSDCSTVLADFDQFILGEPSQVVQQGVRQLIADEYRYKTYLDEAVQVFLSSNVPSAFVGELSAMFDSFPHLYLLHLKWLERLDKTFKKYILDRPFKVQQIGLSKLCRSFFKYIKKGQLECYREYSKTYISSQWRLWCYINHEYQFDEDQMDNAVRLSEWLFRQATDNKSHSLEHATNYLDLPVPQLQRNCGFFNKLRYLKVNGASTVCEALEEVSANVKASIEESRRQLGITRLCNSYKLAAKDKALIKNYLWDTLLEVRLRVYVEPGSHKFKTFDTLLNQTHGKSAVCEVFSEKKNMLRLICSGKDIRVWDETVGQMVCSFKHHDLEVRLDGRDIILIFRPVDDLYVCRLVSFATVELTCQRESMDEHAFRNAVERGKLELEST